MRGWQAKNAQMLMKQTKQMLMANCAVISRHLNTCDDMLERSVKVRNAVNEFCT